MYLKVESCTNFSAPLRLKQKNSLCNFAVDARQKTAWTMKESVAYGTFSDAYYQVSAMTVWMNTHTNNLLTSLY